MSGVGDFAELADRFCALIEDAGRSDVDQFLGRIEEVLARIYVAAGTLPDVEPDSHVDPSEHMTSEEWQRRFEGLRTLLGPRDVYYRTFDADDAELVQASIADDLVDIYRDLGSGLRLLRSGVAPPDVIREWRSAFFDHWGRHAVGALEAIRALRRPT